MIERYSQYRLYLLSKLDEGSTLSLSQLRDSFLANQRHQQAARRASASMHGGPLGMLSSAPRPAHGPSSTRSSPEAFELQGDRMVTIERPSDSAPAEGDAAGAPFSFSSLIEATKRKQAQGQGQGQEQGQEQKAPDRGSGAAQQQGEPMQAGDGDMPGSQAQDMPLSFQQWAVANQGVPAAEPARGSESM